MQIVIDIDEKCYNRIIDWHNKNIQLGPVFNAIINGTPLPKGHGRLIDADELQDYFEDNRSKLFHSKDCIVGIDNTPTIIETDISGKEKNDECFDCL